MIVSTAVQPYAVERHGSLVTLRAGLLPPPTVTLLDGHLDALIHGSAGAVFRTLWGLHEVAAVFGVARSTAHGWTERSDFPPHVVRLHCGPVWLAHEVLAWHAGSMYAPRRPWPQR